VFGLSPLVVCIRALVKILFGIHFRSVEVALLRAVTSSAIKALVAAHLGSEVSLWSCERTRMVPIFLIPTQKLAVGVPERDVSDN
jgi:hypothetical protein